MLSFSILWLIAGLMVLYNIGIDEIIASMGMESVMLGTGEKSHNPVTQAIMLFFIVLMWPIIWLEYLESRS